MARRVTLVVEIPEDTPPFGGMSEPYLAMFEALCVTVLSSEPTVEALAWLREHVQKIDLAGTS